MAKRAKELYKQLTISQRRILEASLNDGLALTKAAARMGVSVSTVRREILRNRRHDGSSKSANRDKNDCAFLKSCKVRHCCGEVKGCRRMCRACPRPCERYCPEYVPKVCEAVAKAPFCCNACPRYSMCVLDRWKYSAETAQKLAEERASSARAGIDLTDGQVADLVAKVKAGRAKGQSIHHIFATEEMPCSERTFYRYVDEGKVPVIALDLAKKVKYKQRKKRAAPSAHEKGFYKGCEYSDFQQLPDEERARATEIDTVLGAKGDKQCILSLHRVDLHFQLYVLLPDKTAASVVRALDWVEMSCEGAFDDLFGVALFDRGSEFDAIGDMEASYLHSGKRLDAYFTDPSRPDQKGGCEKNHVELRKLIPQGTSLDKLDAATLTEICCHVNSTVRKGCGDVSPMELAQLVFPKEMMDNLGLDLIPPREVISAPGILYDPDRVW